MVVITGMEKRTNEILRGQKSGPDYTLELFGDIGTKYHIQEPVLRHAFISHFYFKYSHVLSTKKRTRMQ